MTTRIHLVLTEEEKARFERAARKEGRTLSAWIRTAARERLETSAPPPLASTQELKAFFSDCDERETGKESDWETHRRVIESSLRTGRADN